MDLAFLDLKTLLFEFVRNIRIRDGAIKRIVLAHFAANRNLDFIEHLLELLRIFFLLRFFSQQ
jgi:hypothetical protein